MKIVVIGGSAGAIPSLVTIFEGFANFPAPIFVVVHMSPDAKSVLPRLLEYASHLPARHVRGEAPIAPGQIYVAPPNWHLVLTPTSVITTMGPKENLSRPSLDVLFRSAADVHGSNVIAVLLSGYLGDGAEGLLAVKKRGGTVIVQNPNDTPYGDMARHALAKVRADHVLPLFEIAPTLRRLVTMPARPSGLRGMVRRGDPSLRSY